MGQHSEHAVIKITISRVPTETEKQKMKKKGHGKVMKFYECCPQIFLLFDVIGKLSISLEMHIGRLFPHPNVTNAKLKQRDCHGICVFVGSLRTLVF